MDPMTVFVGAKAGFEALKLALDTMKDAKNLSDPTKTREQVIEISSKVLDLKEMVLSLRESLNESREKILSLEEDIRKKDLEIAKLKSKSSEFDLSGYRLGRDGHLHKDGGGGGVFCATCSKTHGPTALVRQSGRLHQCPRCKQQSQV